MDTVLIRTGVFLGIILFAILGLIVWDKIEDNRQRKLKTKIN